MSFLFVEIHIGKEGVKHSKYQKYLGETSSRNKRMMESTKGVGQKSVKGGTKDCFLFLIVVFPQIRL